VNPSPINLSAAPMDVDASSAALKASDNTLGFLRRLMKTDTGEDAGILGRVVLLIHAALLDTGSLFLTDLDLICLRDGLCRPFLSVLTLNYTLSDFVDQVHAINEKFAVLKFSVLGNLVTIYTVMWAGSNLISTVSA
jgi:hypothetical protein